MQNKIKKILKNMPTLAIPFAYAFVGILKELTGPDNHFCGTYDAFLQ